MYSHRCHDSKWMIMLIIYCWCGNKQLFYMTQMIVLCLGYIVHTWNSLCLNQTANTWVFSHACPAQRNWSLCPRSWLVNDWSILAGLLLVDSFDPQKMRAEQRSASTSFLSARGRTWVWAQEICASSIVTECEYTVWARAEHIWAREQSFERQYHKIWAWNQ